jgi:hypothetical protein
MADWAPRLRRQAALDALDVRLAGESEAIGLRFERACLLTELGRTEEAKAAYLDLLTSAPGHAGALNNFGTLLHATGYRSAARTAYAEAAARHPDDPMGHVNLANLLLEAGELEPARSHYGTALRLMPDHAEAHQGLGNLLAELGDAAGAERHRRLGFKDRALTTLPYRGAGPPLPLLLLVSAAGGNIPIRPLLDDRVFQTSVVATEYYDRALPLPPHALVFNSIGDADLCGEALEAAAAILARSTAPVINHPLAVMPTGRVGNARRLAELPDVVAPLTASMPRSLLAASDALATLASHGFAFPLLLRTPGYHMGRHFVRIERPGDLAPALSALPGDELTVLQHLDARGTDGWWRKYRVMAIDGQLYPLHLAVSNRWKVHYFTADMADHAVHRAEEAAFLTNMPDVIGPRGMAALEAVREALDLDYAGIDFGLDADGRILLFEANATMVVNPPEPDERWAYRRPAVERIHHAVRAMLTSRARSTA